MCLVMGVRSTEDRHQASGPAIATRAEFQMTGKTVAFMQRDSACACGSSRSKQSFWSDSLTKGETTMFNFVLGVLAGGVLVFFIRQRAINLARAGEASAAQILQSARNEYLKLKAGLAHRLDAIFK